MSSLKIKSEEFKVDTQTQVKGHFFQRSPPTRKESAGMLFNRKSTQDIGTCTENMRDDSSRNQGSPVRFQGERHYDDSSKNSSPSRSPMPFLIEEQSYSEIVNPVIVSSTRVRKMSPKPRNDNSDITEVNKRYQ